MRNISITPYFIKIAEKQDFISPDAPKKAKEKLDKNPRWGSDTQEKIEKLYNLSPETIKGMDYKNNISESAHKTPAVVSSAHDKINGLVENINERQNILLHILSKTPSGVLYNKKLAQKDLVLALIKVANDLDNQHKDELRILADTCLQQIKKQAFFPALLALLGTKAGLIGAATILTGTALNQHLNNFNEGFEINVDRLLKEIDDLLETNQSMQTSVGAGYTYKAAFLAEVRELKDNVSKFQTFYKEIEETLAELDQVKPGDQLVQAVNQGDNEKVKNAFNKLNKLAATYLPYFEQVQQNFNDPEYVARQIQGKGWLSSLVDRSQVLHGKHGLIADDLEDVSNALSPFIKSVQDLLSLLKNIGSIHQNNVKMLENYALKQQEITQKLDQSNEETSVIPAGVREIDDVAGKYFEELKNKF